MRLATVWVCLILLSQVGWCEETPPKLSPEEIKALIAQLGAESFEARENAYKQLKACGEPAYENVMAALAACDDLEQKKFLGQLSDDCAPEGRVLNGLSLRLTVKTPKVSYGDIVEFTVRIRNRSQETKQVTPGFTREFFLPIIHCHDGIRDMEMRANFTNKHPTSGSARQGTVVLKQDQTYEFSFKVRIDDPAHTYQPAPDKIPANKNNREDFVWCTNITGEHRITVGLPNGNPNEDLVDSNIIKLAIQKP